LPLPPSAGLKVIKDWLPSEYIWACPAWPGGLDETLSGTTVLEVVHTGVGAVTVMVAAAVVVPAELVAVRLTGYVPGFVKLWLADAPLPVPPSPKVQP
jgi:hypothetical protein